MLADVAPGYEIFCTAKGDCIGQGHNSPWTPGGRHERGRAAAGRRSGPGRPGAAPQPPPGPRSGQPAALRHRPLRLGGQRHLRHRRQQQRPGPEPERPRRSAAAPPAAGYDEASGLGSINLAGLALVAGHAGARRSSTSGVSVPSQRHPVAGKHLLATVSCSGRCLMGAFARIRIGRSRKVMTRNSSVFLLKTRRPPDDQDRPGRARPWRTLRTRPGAPAEGHRHGLRGDPRSERQHRGRRRAARICGSGGRPAPRRRAGDRDSAAHAGRRRPDP